MQALVPKLEALGHTGILPLSVVEFEKRGITVGAYDDMKRAGLHHRLTIQHDAIRAHYHKIVESDAILVVNYPKHGEEHYIGGNTFLEMGFAHVHNKPIYILFGIPTCSYTDELHAMQPVCLNGDLDALKECMVNTENAMA